MVVHMAHPVEVYSDTTRGPAHSEEIVRPHASMRSPPFPQPGHGCENESEEREKAHRRPSPTSVVSHEMSSSFVDVPGALATARFAKGPPPPPRVKTRVTLPVPLLHWSRTFAFASAMAEMRIVREAASGQDAGE